MKILIAGGSGVVGRPLVTALVTRGHEVYVLGRSSDKLQVVEELGGRVFECDVFDIENLGQVVANCQPQVIVDQLTQIPAQINPRNIALDMATTNRLRTTGTRNLMQAALENGVERFVTASIAFAYAPTGGEPAVETDALYLEAPGGFSTVVEAVVEHERIALETPGVQGIVLRYGYLYGPGSVYGLEGSFTRSILKRGLPIIGGGSGQLSFVHTEDAAGATVLAIEGEMSGVYNIVDDEPVTLNEFLPWFADLLGAPRPMRLPWLIGLLGAGSYGVYMMTRQPGVANAKAKVDLGWELKYPTWRQGFAAEFGRVGK